MFRVRNLDLPSDKLSWRSSLLAGWPPDKGVTVEGPEVTV